MATLAGRFAFKGRRPDVLSGTPRAHAVDRWIYVFTAASFIAITLAGFIPDAIEKVAAVQAGERPPFPPVMHVHAALMGGFLLLLLAQTTLVALGRCEQHVRLGRAAFVIAPAMVLAGFLLVPAIYHQAWDGLLIAPPEARAKLQQLLLRLDDIMLMQLRIGFLFPIFLAIGLAARKGNPGIHKRMMILATAVALPAAIDRIHWLPNTFPASPTATDLYVVLAVSPMLIWDVIRNRRVHEAYLIWFAVNLLFAVPVHALWDTPWWHATAPKIVGI